MILSLDYFAYVLKGLKPKEVFISGSMTGIPDFNIFFCSEVKNGSVFFVWEVTHCGLFGNRTDFFRYRVLFCRPIIWRSRSVHIWNQVVLFSSHNFSFINRNILQNHRQLNKFFHFHIIFRYGEGRLIICFFKKRPARFQKTANNYMYLTDKHRVTKDLREAAKKVFFS